MYFDYKELKGYKGYGIQKAWWTDFEGKKKKKKKPFYLVCDEEDYIGEEYMTLRDAKLFIDSL